MNTKIILSILIVVGVAVGGFFYFTRPVVAPEIQTEIPAPEEVKSFEEKSGDVYKISSEKSEVSFSIFEMLREKPFTAVGTSNSISGDIQINNAEEQVLAISTLKLGATTFKTESSSRDGAIVRFILKSDKPENAYMTFKPTTISGLPKSILEGNKFSFMVSGDLTISGITKPATFSVDALLSNSILSGEATSTISRADFNLQIPNIPFVASVGESFTVSAKIVANKIVK